MITGKIELHEERKSYGGYQGTIWNEKDWEMYQGYKATPIHRTTSADVDNAIEEEIEEAMKRGLFIGQKVRRRVGDVQAIGIIKHFVRNGAQAYNHWSRTADPIAVQWENWLSTHNYCCNDLVLVTEDVEVIQTEDAL